MKQGITMEKEFYTINELSQMTGFTTRSLRNYILSGQLCGEKIDGIWQFTPEEFEAFISDPNVQPGIKTKNNHVVYDFMAESEKSENQICSILDLNLKPEEMKDFNDYFCAAMNNCSSATYKMEYNNGKMRAIISGPEDFVESTIHGWYSV